MNRKGKGSLLGAAGIGLDRLSKATEASQASHPMQATVAIDTTDLQPNNQEPALANTLHPSTKMRSRNTSKAITSGAVKMQTVYVTRDDQDRATDAVAHLKKMRVVRGQVGFSLAVRIGLQLLEDQLQDDINVVVSIAQRLTQASNIIKG